MTYIRRKDVTDKIANKYEAVKVAALEARRLNERARSLGVSLPGKLTTLAVQRLIDGKIEPYDRLERASQLQLDSYSSK
jgi:DNA-directed RNA polymerase subunit K/omega